MPIRPADDTDIPFMRRMLYEAGAWRPDERAPLERVLAEPRVARYLAGWGRPGDSGVVAEEGGRAVGAAWYRLFRAQEPGHGFVSEDVPELTIGVEQEARGRGVGEALLRELVQVARRDGHSSLSLSVEPDNAPALRLYRRMGFDRVAEDGDALTMELDVKAAQ